MKQSGDKGRSQLSYAAAKTPEKEVAALAVVSHTYNCCLSKVAA